MESAFLFCFIGSILVTVFIFLVSAIRIVPEDTRLSVYRLGRHIGDKGPGVVVVIPLIDRAEKKELSALDKTHRVLGDVGETRTTVYADGKVFVAGEEWDAVSQGLISAGQRVRVVRVILEVEKE